jgi:hypothetical protein
MATPTSPGPGRHVAMSRGFTNIDARACIDGTAKDLGLRGFDCLTRGARVDAPAPVTKSRSFPAPGDVTPPTVALPFPPDGRVIDARTVK